MSYGSDALVTAVALKYTVVAESALTDSHRYSRSSSPLATLFVPQIYFLLWEINAVASAVS